MAVRLTNDTQKASTIGLYKEGFPVTENFEPPAKPESVTVGDITHSSVTLKISPPKVGTEKLMSYSAEYVCGEDGWQQKTESKAVFSGTIAGREVPTRCQSQRMFLVTHPLNSQWNSENSDVQVDGWN